MRKALCIILAFAICSLSIFSYVYAEENKQIHKILITQIMNHQI